MDAVPIPWRLFPYHGGAGAHRGFPSSVGAVVVDHQNPPHQGMRPEVRHRGADAGFVVVCGQDYGEVGVEYRIDRNAPMRSFLGQLKLQLGGHEDHSQQHRDAAEVQQRVFERYYQVDAARTPTQPRRGTGLGLAIVKHAVRGLGGTIRVQSVWQQGTTMIVDLPECIAE